MASSLYRAQLPQVFPPWLRRIVGTQLLAGIGAILDEQVDRLADGVKLRFPGVGDASALPYLGRDRRIRRGITEGDASYASRLRQWLDAHRIRGGPYALLEQLRAFWLSDFNVRIDVVYRNYNRRFWIGTDGVITGDFITGWGGDDGPWARTFHVFFHLGDQSDANNALVTGTGAELVTDDGDTIVAPIVNAESISAVDAEMFKLVPREWSAAHIQYVTIVLLYEAGGVEARCWNYPQPVPTWADWGASGATWGGPSPVVLTTE